VGTEYCIKKKENEAEYILPRICDKTIYQTTGRIQHIPLLITYDEYTNGKKNGKLLGYLKTHNYITHNYVICSHTKNPILIIDYVDGYPHGEFVFCNSTGMEEIIRTNFIHGMQHGTRVEHDRYKRIHIYNFVLGKLIE